MIRVWHPRYHDNSVLIARYKIPCGGDVDLEIMKGAYKGLYRAKNETLISSPIESVTSRNGRPIQMRVVPIDKLERIDQ